MKILLKTVERRKEDAEKCVEIKFWLSTMTKRVP